MRLRNVVTICLQNNFFIFELILIGRWNKFANKIVRVGIKNIRKKMYNSIGQEKLIRKNHLTAFTTQWRR